MRSQFLAYDGLQSCPYLPGRVARLPLWRQQRRLDPDDADAAFAAGERRVGRGLYHTACPTCAECLPLRILVEEFAPSRSQRRVLRKWEADGRVEISAPTVSDTHLALYNRHKRERGLASDDDLPMDTEGYVGWLVDSCVDTVEMRYWYRDQLVGIGIIDVGRTAISSVYFYFDPSPEMARLSPGVWSTLSEVELCKRTGRPYLYLGLYVGDCRQLNYKADYHPHERFVDGDWRRFDAEAS